MAGGEAILERLTHPEVADFLIRGARFIKWDDVSRNVFNFILAGRVVGVTLFVSFIFVLFASIFSFSMRIGTF